MDHILRKQVQLIHPEKMYPYLKGISETNLAALYGLSAAEYASLKREFAGQVAILSGQLLADVAFVEQLRAIPFQEEERILVLGESTTDDWLSWFEIFTNCLHHAFPQKLIQCHNAALSGQTTTLALRKLTADLAAQPTLVICMLGINDSVHIGDQKTLVSEPETKANLAAIREITRHSCQPRWVWITPYTLDESKQMTNPWLNQMQLRWRNTNLVPLIDYLLTRTSDLVLNLQQEFTQGESSDFLAEDGIHLSTKGHTRLVTGLVRTLAAA